MEKKLITIILILQFVLLGSQKIYAQCGLTQQEQREFGWICDPTTNGYKPSAGFPGNPNKIKLQEVNVFAAGNPLLYPYTARPAYPVIFVVQPSPSRPKPSPGDPLVNPQIAPSNRSGTNYRGGMYGLTRTRPDGTKKFHDGMDILATPGTDIFAMHDGKIVDINKSFNPGEYRRNSYGNYITVRSVINGVTVYLKYNHLDAISSTATVGSDVTAGTVIGKAGTTGNAASPDVRYKHLHLQGKDANMKSIDPAPYFFTKFDPSTGRPIK
ncbi:MAG: M23 family metallopeptidase [Pseudosphingobacterium sp.]|nr:M23 family metallopeptidase [Pseudosphingobacterium sp.]